jgi:NAD(P)-dependent dehydrogenase (short-subunit alcohol dehydrogenase family)
VDLKLNDRVVFITGSGSGLGRKFALDFAAEGARVAVNDVNAAGIEQTVDLVKQAGGKAMPAPCDITRLEAIAEMVRKVEAEYGRIDILVNNAAVLLAHALFLETSPEDCDREIKVILYGTLNCARALLPGMIERQYGKIVNIVTDAARAGQEREVNYSSAKGGVISFTKSIAREVGRHNINVNAVSPAATNSPMRLEGLRQLKEKIGEQKLLEREEKIRRAYPMRRIGEPEDVSHAVLFLASDLARHITGQVLSVNGGYAMPG